MNCPRAVEGALVVAAAQGDKRALREARVELAAGLVEVREALAAALVTREALEAKGALEVQGVAAGQAVAAMVVLAALAEALADLQVRPESPAEDSPLRRASEVPAPASWHFHRAAMVLMGFTEPSLVTPWEFGSMTDAFRNDDYDLLECVRMSEPVGG